MRKDRVTAVDLNTESALFFPVSFPSGAVGCDCLSLTNPFMVLNVNP